MLQDREVRRGRKGLVLHSVNVYWGTFCVLDASDEDHDRGLLLVQLGGCK